MSETCPAASCRRTKANLIVGLLLRSILLRAMYTLPGQMPLEVRIYDAERKLVDELKRNSN